MVILLDTTILVYAVGTEHPLRALSQRILAAHRAGTISAAATVEVIQEFVHVRSRRWPRPNAAQVGLDYLTSLEIAPTQPADLRLGLDLYQRHPRLGSFDSVLAAVAINQRAEALISADRAFGDVDKLRWLSPGDPALERLLEGGDRSAG